MNAKVKSRMHHNQTGFFDLDKEDVHLPGAELSVYRHFFSIAESSNYLDRLHKEIEWKQEEIIVFGRKTPIPRLSAWYGDLGASYTYSGIVMSPIPWTPLLLQIRNRLIEATQSNFNSLLANLYRDGQDSVGWHADDEIELGDSPTIASLSFGESRKFKMKQKQKKGEKFSLDLNDGDLLIMKGDTQKNWLHEVPSSAKKMGPRINLTFRKICISSDNI